MGQIRVVAWYRLVGVMGIAALAGCTAVLTYPAPGDESGACGNHRDDDYDGLTDCDDDDCAVACDESAQCDDGEDDDEDDLRDCADPDCDGAPACDESRGELCDDHRDNDLDGRIDARDGGCWPFAGITIERCASVLGSELTLGPEDFSGGLVETTPDGGRGHLLPTSASGEPTTVQTWPATGRTDGLRARVEVVHTGPAQDGFLVGLGVGIGERGPAASIGVAIGHGTADLGGVFEDASSVRTAPFVVGPDLARVTVDVALDGARLAVDLTNTAGASAHLEGTVPSSWTGAHDARLELAGFGSGTSWIAHASLTMPRRERCEGPQPPVGVSQTGGYERASTALYSVARGEDAVLCALVAIRARGASAIYGLRSDDDGRTWARGEPLEGIGTTLPVALGSAPIVAFDPIARSWNAARVVVDRLVTYGSPDCLAWGPPTDGDVDLAPLVPYTPTTPLAYQVDARGHALTIATRRAGMPALVTLRSPWAEPVTWTIDAAVPLPPAAAPTNAIGLVRLVTPGASVVLLEGGQALQVLGPGPAEASAPVPLLAASGEAGAFDASSTAGPVALIEDQPVRTDGTFTGRLFYSGEYDLAPDEGWGYARITIRIGAAR